MRQGINWIHGKEGGKKRQLVGGNAWGSNIPDGTDFISITDRGGMGSVADLSAKITAQKVPLLMHIRNDPHIHKSEGVWWTKRGPDYRRDVLKDEVEGEKHGYHYMYPVFFPLYEHSECHPGPRRSYNAAEDHNLLRKMCAYMDGSDDKCKTAPSKLFKAAPQGWEEEGGEQPAYVPRIAVHRGYNPNRQQHLFSTSLVELENGPGLVVERENDFFLQGDGASGSVPFHRCYLGNGWHLYTTAPDCEGAAGATNEGVMGYVSPGPAEGAVPLYRLFRGAAPDHFYTVDPAERDYAVALGYVYEGIGGYVWSEP
jgi:hypothetical protein